MLFAPNTECFSWRHFHAHLCALSPINSLCFSGKLTMKQFYLDAYIATRPIWFLPSTWLWPSCVFPELIELTKTSDSVLNVVGQTVGSRSSDADASTLSVFLAFGLCVLTFLPSQPVPVRWRGSSVLLPFRWATRPNFAVHSLLHFSTYFLSYFHSFFPLLCTTSFSLFWFFSPNLFQQEIDNFEIFCNC